MFLTFFFFKEVVDGGFPDKKERVSSGFEGYSIIFVWFAILLGCF